MSSLSAQSVEVVREFCEAVSERNVVNLRLLKAIDRTIGWLSGLRKQADGEIEIARKFVELIEGDKVFIEEIDPETKICSSLQKAKDAVKRSIDVLRAKQQAAERDPQLQGESKECIVDDYQETIDCYSELYDALDQLTQAVQKHDKEMNELVGPFTTAEAAIKALRTK